MRTSPESSRSTPEISPCACRNALSICSAALMNRSPAPVSLAPVVRRANSFAPAAGDSEEDADVIPIHDGAYLDETPAGCMSPGLRALADGTGIRYDAWRAI